MKKKLAASLIFLSLGLYLLADAAEIVSMATDPLFKPYGIGTAVDARNYGSLNAAVMAVGSSPATLVVSDKQSLTASLTIPPNIFLWVIKSGMIQKGSTLTLTIGGGFRADGQAFAGFDPGEVVFSAGAIDTVSSEWWGARADGTTECGGPIRAALGALGATGGKLALRPGVYYLDSHDTSLLSTDEYLVFAVPSNVELKGAASMATSLKLSKTLQRRVPGRINIIGTRPGTSGQIIRDLNFDYNGITLDIPFRCYNAVRALGGRILLERLYIKNAPGRNMIVTTTEATIRDCTIINGSKNVPGNNRADDASFVYMMGTDNLVERCSFTNDSSAVTNCGGVEMHATNSKIINSIFNNLWPAIYSGVEDHRTIAYGNEISGNRITHSSGGITIIDRHVGLKVLKNYFKNNVSKGNYTIMTPRDNNTGITGAGAQDDVTIADNTFDGTDGVRVAGFQNSSILNNRWKGVPAAIELLGSTTPMKNILVAYNRFIDPPSAGSLVGQIQMDGSTNKAWSAVYEDILIKDNIFASNRTTAAPSYVYPLVPAGHTSYTAMTNVVFRGNEVVNLVGNVKGNMASYVRE